MPHRIVRYRVRREGKLCLIVDTVTKTVMATHTDPTEAHMQAGTLNYQHRVDILAEKRRHQLHETRTRH
jgi:hypothetical protein